MLGRATPVLLARTGKLVNEAAILAARRNKKVIEQSEFEEASNALLPVRNARAADQSGREKNHRLPRSGHAVVINTLPKATLFRRSRSSPEVWQAASRYLCRRRPRPGLQKKLIATMVGMLGGRAAEEVIFDDITSGASSDIENVTKLARRMVTRLGMSRN
jgi:cell division protease FtsH